MIFGDSINGKSFRVLTQDMLDMLVAIKPYVIIFTIDTVYNNTILKTLHNSNDNEVKYVGVYVWVNLRARYVGSSTNVGRRVREHLRGAGSTKLHANIIEHGLHNFHLHVYIVSKGYDMKNEIVVTNMLALEQYFILTINPVLNVLKTAETLFTLDGGSPKSKSIYIYKEGTLIYSGPSLTTVAKDLGLTVDILAGALKRGSLYYQFVVTEIPPREGIPTNILPPEQLTAMVTDARRIRYDADTFLTLPFATPVSITDIETGNSYLVRSIKQAAQVTKDIGRPVSKSTIRRYLMKETVAPIKSWTFGYKK